MFKRLAPLLVLLAALGFFGLMLGTSRPPAQDQAPAAVPPAAPAVPGIPLQFADTLPLESPAARLEVAPGIGRIVAFGPPAGPDLLWRNSEAGLAEAREKNAWLNYGGDKLWPTQQCNWSKIHVQSWPPDRSLDGSAWEVLKTEKNLVGLRSPVSPDLNVRFTREISLLEGAAGVAIKNSLEQVAPSPFPVFIWSITQIRPPEFCLLDIAPEQPFADKPFVLLSKDVPPTSLVAAGRALRLEPLAGKSVKVGTFGRWLAAVFPDYVLLQQGAYAPGECYPERANMEIYWDAKNGWKPTADNWPQREWNSDYVELEPIGPFKHLKAGEKLEYVVTWKLLPRPQGADDAQLVELCRQAAGK